LDAYSQKSKKLIEAAHHDQPLLLESQDFFLKLAKDVQIVELEDESNKMRMATRVLPKDSKLFGFIDYLAFADLIGYEMPKGSDKEGARKIFYRALLKDLGGIENIRELQARIAKNDYDGRKVI
jgi:hypothetical protein